MGDVLGFNVEDAPEMGPVEEGQYTVRVTREPEVRTGKNDANVKFLLMFLEIVGEPTADDVVFCLFYPNPDKPEKQNNRTLGEMKKCLMSLGLPTDGTVTTEDFVNAEGQVILSLREDDEGKMRNNVKEWVVE